MQTIKSRLFPLFILVFFASIISLYKSGIYHVGDDLWFSEKAKEMALWDFISWRYLTWSSRTPIEAAIHFLINKIALWSVLNSLIAAALAASIVFLCKPNSVRNMLIALFLFTLGVLGMPSKALTEGAYWMTGSFNYLWPVALSALFFAFISKSIDGQKSYRLPAALCMFFSSFSEQVAIVNLLLIIVLAVNIKKEQRNELIIPAFCLIAVLIYIVSCPGNTLRYTQELNHWFPNYAEFGLVGKIMLGFNIVYAQYFHFSLTPLLLTLAIAVRCNTLTLRLALFALSAFILLIAAENKYEFISAQRIASLLHVERLTSSSYLSAGAILKAVILNLSIVLSAIGMLMMSGSLKERINAFLFYVISFAPTMVLMLSPTIYASNDRIFFVSCVMQAALAAYLVTEKLKSSK